VAVGDATLVAARPPGTLDPHRPRLEPRSQGLPAGRTRPDRRRRLAALMESHRGGSFDRRFRGRPEAIEGHIEQRRGSRHPEDEPSGPLSGQ